MTFTDWYNYPQTYLAYAPSVSEEIQFGGDNGPPTDARILTFFKQVNLFDSEYHATDVFPPNSTFRIVGKLVDENDNGIVGKAVYLQPYGIAQQTFEMGTFDFEHMISDEDKTIWVEFMGDNDYQGSKSIEKNLYIADGGTWIRRAKKWFESFWKWLLPILQKYWWVFLGIGAVIIILWLVKKWR